MAIDVNKPGSPGWWLDTLSKRLTVRRSVIDSLDDYITGNAPLPEGAEGLRAAYRAFQTKARTNLAELVVEAVAERMTVAGFRTGNPDLDKVAAQIWSANELGVGSADVHDDMLGLAYGYAMVGPAESSAARWDWLPWRSSNTGLPVITPEDPRNCITAHHPLRPHIVIAALKMYRDEVEGKDIAWVYLPGNVYVASKRSPQGDGPLTIDGLEWEAGNPRKLKVNAVPIVRFANRKDKGEFETHTDLLDRINYVVLQRLVIIALQAYRQRAVKGELPQTDESGDAVDYNAIFRPGPGALWMLPEGVELWESQITPIQDILNAAKDDIRDLAAVTRTPMSMLLPDGQNQSAEGAAFAREGLVFKAKDRIKRATYGWNTAMQLALAFAGHGQVNVETDWMDVERLSLAEKADAWSKMADIPFGTKTRIILQAHPDERERMEQERADDVFSTVLSQPVTPNGV